MKKIFSNWRGINAKKTRQDTVEILRNKHSIFVLITVTSSRGKNCDLDEPGPEPFLIVDVVLANFTTQPKGVWAICRGEKAWERG